MLDSHRRPALHRHPQPADARADLRAGRFRRSGSPSPVNHLKSKGSACTGDPDTGDGAGQLQRHPDRRRPRRSSDWLATDPTNSGDPDRLIIGDLNSYDHEDPIDVLVAGGYTDLIKKFGGEYAYGYVFDGQVGYLDHALANASLVPQVTGAAEWHINADEPTLLDYDMTFKNRPEDALYEPNAYRSSDHDPVIVGMELGIRQCQFSDNPATSTRTLLADCDTSRTILVPNGWTLDGAGHSITAKDPADGHFLGAVVRNAGTSASVRNLTVTASSLNDVCDGGDDRLRGILLDGASGSIVEQPRPGHQPGCEWLPGGQRHRDPQRAVRRHRRRRHHRAGQRQRGARLPEGRHRRQRVGQRHRPRTTRSTVSDRSTTSPRTASSSAFGATGVAESNTISDNFYTGPDLGCGLLFFEADGVKQKKNTFSGNERDVCNFGRGGGGSPTKK